MYIGPYEISKCVRDITYELDIPSELVIVRPVFHVSMLNKCIVEPYLVVPIESME